jgi:hypothetical protein
MKRGFSGVTTGTMDTSDSYPMGRRRCSFSFTVKFPFFLCRLSLSVRNQPRSRGTRTTALPCFLACWLSPSSSSLMIIVVARASQKKKCSLLPLFLTCHPSTQPINPRWSSYETNATQRITHHAADSGRSQPEPPAHDQDQNMSTVRQSMHSCGAIVTC